MSSADRYGVCGKNASQFLDQIQKIWSQCLAATESAIIWSSSLSDLKDRGKNLVERKNDEIDLQGVSSFLKVHVLHNLHLTQFSSTFQRVSFGTNQHHLLIQQSSGILQPRMTLAQTIGSHLSAGLQNFLTPLGGVGLFQMIHIGT